MARIWKKLAYMPGPAYTLVQSEGNSPFLMHPTMDPQKINPQNGNFRRLDLDSRVT